MSRISRRFGSARGAALRSVLITIVVVLLLVSGLGYTFGNVVGPEDLGVRQIAFGPGQGLSSKALSPGYHWNIPFYSKIYILPRQVRMLNFRRGKVLHGVSAPPLTVTTSGRAILDVEITVLTKLYAHSGEEGGVAHGGPADLIQRVGVASEKWDALIRTVAENALRIALGKLSSDQFYEPELRDAQIAEAIAAMRVELAPVGISVEDVLLQRYTYQDDSIEESIFQKNLEAQNRAVASATTALTSQEKETKRIRESGEAKINTTLVDGKAQADVIRSRAALFEQQKMAEGDLLTAQATAEVDKLKNQALTAGPGAEIYVGRKLAPMVGSLKGGVVNDVDPFDVEAWVRRFGIGRK